jgi:hypothetical protein
MGTLAISHYTQKPGKVLTEGDSTEKCLFISVNKRTAELDPSDVLTMIAGTMTRSLTIRHSGHERSRGRSQEEKLTDINPSGVEATSHQATGKQEMGTRNKQLYRISNGTLLQ